MFQGIKKGEGRGDIQAFSENTCTAMAVAYDGIFVLRQILNQREQEIETQSTRNNIVEQLYSQSPLNYDKLQLHSYSLELQQRLTQMPSTYIDPTVTDYKG